jgi:hypothetical protein
MDNRRFVDELMAAVPEAFTDRDAEDFREEPLAYTALGHVRIWLEENALQVSILPRRKARVRAQHVDVFQRFWGFVETQAGRGRGDGDLETLLQIECFEGVGWVSDVSAYLGPRTHELLLDAQRWLASYNRQVGRWAGKSNDPEPRS